MNMLLLSHWNKEQTDSNQRGAGTGIMAGNRGRSIKEHEWRTHGQSQRGWVWGWEAGMGGAGAKVRWKWRQLYLTNKKIHNKFKNMLLLSEQIINIEKFNINKKWFFLKDSSADKNSYQRSHTENPELGGLALLWAPRMHGAQALNCGGGSEHQFRRNFNSLVSQSGVVPPEFFWTHSLWLF